MVEMEMGNEERIDGAPVKLVDEGKRGDSSEGRMDTSITYYRLACDSNLKGRVSPALGSWSSESMWGAHTFVADDAAAATDLLTSAEHLNRELVFGRGGSSPSYWSIVSTGTR